MLRLLAIVAALSTLLALSGLLELGHHCDSDHHDDGGHHPTACVCVCHVVVAALPETAPVPTVPAPMMTFILSEDDRRPLDVRIAIDPPPDKRGT